MTPDMIAQLAAGRASLTFLFRLDLPDAPRHLLLGSTEVMWGADKGVDGGDAKDRGPFQRA
jgi:hypothetical protein